MSAAKLTVPTSAAGITLTVHEPACPGGMADVILADENNGWQGVMHVSCLLQHVRVATTGTQPFGVRFGDVTMYLPWPSILQVADFLRLEIPTPVGRVATQVQA